MSGSNPFADSSSGSSRRYPNPFATRSNLLVPRSIEEMLRWSEHLWVRNPTYAEALRRVVRYFVTKVEVECDDDKENKRITDFLNDNLQINEVLARIGEDFVCYGNSFRTMYSPFRRMLVCQHCHVRLPVERVDYRFNSGVFSFTCNSCHRPASCSKPEDVPSHEDDRIAVTVWNPHDIKIRDHPVSGAKETYWIPPADVVSEVNRGDRFYVDSMPWEMIEAVLKRKPFKFEPDVIFHIGCPAPSGIRTRGWGITPQLAAFQQAYYVQMLKASNEVLASDAMIPLRAISPGAGPGQGNGSDPSFIPNYGSFNRHVMKALSRNRRHPGEIVSVPVPIVAQSVFGDGIKYSTHELIGQGMDELLSGVGVPPSMYRGDLTIQAAPMALRLFQMNWNHLYSAYNRFLFFVMKQLHETFNFEKAGAHLQPVTTADDAQNLSVLLQLAASGQVSKARAFSTLGIDPDEDEQQRYNEQKRTQERETKFQSEMQNKQKMQEAVQQGSQPPGGAAPAGPSTPHDVMDRGRQIAEQLLAMPDGPRRSELIKLKKSDETLWAVVKAQLQNQRNEASSEGRQAVLQQRAQSQQNNQVAGGGAP